MKKLLILATLILLSFNIKAQDIITYDNPFSAYATGYISPRYSLNSNKPSCCLCTGISLYYDICENVSLQSEVLLNQTLLFNYHAEANISLGVEWYFYNCICLYGNIMPIIDVYDNNNLINHNYYSIYSIYSEFNIGLGYWIDLGSGGLISIKGGIFKDFNFIHTVYQKQHDIFCFALTIGYHYQLN